MQRHMKQTKTHRVVKRIILLPWIFAACITSAQTPQYDWVKVLPFEIAAMCTDNHDNIYVAGTFPITIVIDNDTLIPNKSDVVIVKYNNSGILQWYKQFGGISYDYAWDIECDYNNDIVITNEYNYSTVYYGDTIVSPGHGVMMVKLDQSGNYIWHILPAYVDDYCMHPHNTTIDRDNNIYLSGNFHYGNLIFPDTSFPYSTAYQSFVAKYDAAGNFINARKFSWGLNYVSTDKSGNLWVLSDSVFKYSGNNIPLLQKSWNQKISEYLLFPFIANDSLDNFYLARQYTNQYLLVGTDSVKFPDSMITIMAKFDPTGTPILVQTAKSKYGITPKSISQSKSNLFITGNYFREAIFGIDTLNSLPWAPGYYSNNSFLAGYDLAGNMKFLHNIQSKHDCIAEIVAAGKSIYLSGNFKDTAYFDSLTAATPQYPYNFFLARLSYHSHAPNINSDTLKIYPNPASQSVTVEFDSEGKESVLEIYNMQGNSIMKHQAEGSSVNINLQGLNQGVYLMIVKTETTTLIRKFIKI